MEKSKKKISRIITVRLFIAVFIAFIVSSAVTYAVLYIYCEQLAYDLLFFNTSGVSTDLEGETKKMIADSDAYMLADSYWKGGEKDAMDGLRGTNYTYFVRKDGTVFLSGNEAFIGRNVRDIETISSIMDYMIYTLENGGEESYYQSTAFPVKTLDGKHDVYYMVLGHVEHPDAFLVAAYDTETYENQGRYAGEVVASNRRIGRTGYYVIINPDNTMFTTDPERYLKPFPYTELIDRYERDSDNSVQTCTVQMVLDDGARTDIKVKLMKDRGTFWDTDCYYMLFKKFNVYILSLYPADEALAQANNTIVLILIIEVIVFAVLFIVLSLLIRRRVIRKLDTVNTALSEITEGNLDARVEVRDTYEFDVLSTDINATVDRLKEYIAEAAARFDADLAVAKAIQSSALPSDFPPFPERKEFELFASMNAAKEVGGDFYDFYMLDDHTLGFLIADVSGKSIPGAMFMMTAKSTIKNLAENGMPPAEVFTMANEKLCEGNEAEMFVTAWLGYLDLNTGLVRVANAGHNPPVLIHNGKAEYVILKPGLMLAGMDGVRYKEQTLQLEKGDILYLYTDGVTEAMDKDEEQYGEDRLQKLLSFGENYPVPSEENGIAEPVCNMVTADVAAFTNGAEQSDDITMLCIRYIGGQ